MFETHQKEIGRFARDNADNMFRVVVFVHATIQQQLNIIPEIMEDIDVEGLASIHLWGYKRAAYEWFDDNKDQVYQTAMAIYDGHADPADCEHELLKYFATLPGLGLVKGGFVIQLCFGLSGCIDRHNIARFGIPKRQFDASRFNAARMQSTRNRIVRQYHEVVAKGGGTQALWDGWCAYVAEKQSAVHESAWAVSRLHCEAIGTR